MLQADLVKWLETGAAMKSSFLALEVCEKLTMAGVGCCVLYLGGGLWCVRTLDKASAMWYKE